MSDVKWIKVMVDMFEHDKIDFIRSLPEGDAIIVIWVQMLAIAGKSNYDGYLMITEDIPYTEEMLCTKMRRTPVIFRFALDTLQRLKMVSVDEQRFYITNWEKHQNVIGMEKIRSDAAKRVAKHREKKKLLQSNVTNTLHVTHGNDVEVERDKEKDTTTRDDFEKVRISYRELHKTMDLPYQDSLILTRLLEDGFTPDHIIGIMNDRYKPTVKTLRYYEGAIRDSVSTGSYRSRGKGQAAHHQKPTADKELDYRRMEIARNKWIDAGGNPDEFEYGPA